jgi:hypothetical protein
MDRRKILLTVPALHWSVSHCECLEGINAATGERITLDTLPDIRNLDFLFFPWRT